MRNLPALTRAVLPRAAAQEAIQAVSVELLLRAGALNGERPGWDAERQRLFWVDIREPALHMSDPATRDDVSWEMPAWIGCCALDEGGDAMVALATGLYHIALDTGTLTPLAHSPFDARRFTFDDGRCNPRGRFFGGTMCLPLHPGDMGGEARTAPLWCYDGGGRWTGVTAPVSMSNGLAWSPDGRTMDHADTDPKTVWTYDCDLDTGTPFDKRVFMRALGGPGLKTLFVTSATDAMSPEERARRPDEGGLFALEAPVPGVLPNLFSGAYR